MIDFLMLGETCVRASEVSHITLEKVETRNNKDDSFSFTTYRAVVMKKDQSFLILMKSEDREQVVGFIDKACCKLNVAIDS